MSPEAEASSGGLDARRNSFATHLIDDGYHPLDLGDLRDKDVKTTMIYTHVLKGAGIRGVRSPADTLWGSIPRASPDTRRPLSQPNFLTAEVMPSRQLEAGEHFGDDPADSEEDF